MKLFVKKIFPKETFEKDYSEKNIIVITTYHRHFFAIAEEFYKLNRLEFLLSGIPSFKAKGLGKKKNYIWINKLGFISILLRRIIDKRGFPRFNAFLENSNSFFCDLSASKFLLGLRLKDYFFRRNKKRILVVSGHIGYLSILIAKKFNWIVICDMPISNTRKIYKRLEREFLKMGLMQFIPKNTNYLREEKAIKFADYLAVPNKFCKESFVCIKNQSKIFIAPYPLPKWETISKEMLIRNKKQSFKIITIGRLGIRKGTHILANIYKEIEDIIDEWILIGQESVEIGGKLKDLKKLKKIRIVGLKSHSEIKKLLMKSTIFVLPSIGEGMPYSIAEALHYQCKIICSKYCGILNGENPNIHVIDEIDPKIFASKIYEIFELWKKNKIYDNFELRNLKPYQLENDYKKTWQNIIFKVTNDLN